jgi:beta-phosphoglucomutase-like phosphatase (HAD superfamily)
VAVEDSGPGWEAARAAHLTCVVVANDETDLLSVKGAHLIVDGFGPHPAVLEDRFRVMNSATSVAGVLAQLLTRASIET